MRIILHLDESEAQFQTDKHGDLHIYGKGKQVDLSPLPRKRKRRPKNPPVPPAGLPAESGVPYTEPPAEDKQQYRSIVLDDKGWQ
jgi:hypothetical protein